MTFELLIETENFLLEADSLPINESFFKNHGKMVTALMSIGVTVGTSSILSAVKDFFASSVDVIGVPYVDQGGLTAAVNAVTRGVLSSFSLPLDLITNSVIGSVISASAIATGSMWLIPPVIALSSYFLISKLSDDVSFRSKYSKLFDLVEKRDKFVSNTFDSKKTFTANQVERQIKRLESMNKAISKQGYELEQFIKKNEKGLNSEELKFVRNMVTSVKKGLVTSSKAYS